MPLWIILQRNSQAFGIDGSNIVGVYFAEGSPIFHGYVFDGATYRTLDHPLAGYTFSGAGTYANAVSGNKVVGYYVSTPGSVHGFLYDGVGYTALDYPGGLLSIPEGIDGATIVGHYSKNSASESGFVFNGARYTSLSYPGSVYSSASGIDGGNIVGSYYFGGHFTDLQFHGFLYDGVSYVNDIDYPGAASTEAHDIIWRPDRRLLRGSVPATPTASLPPFPNPPAPFSPP